VIIILVTTRLELEKKKNKLFDPKLLPILLLTKFYMVGCAVNQAVGFHIKQLLSI
jgi:hypothetical protein